MLWCINETKMFYWSNTSLLLLQHPINYWEHGGSAAEHCNSKTLQLLINKHKINICVDNSAVFEEIHAFRAPKNLTVTVQENWRRKRRSYCLWPWCRVLQAQATVIDFHQTFNVEELLPEFFALFPLCLIVWSLQKWNNAGSYWDHNCQYCFIRMSWKKSKILQKVNFAPHYAVVATVLNSCG